MAALPPLVTIGVNLVTRFTACRMGLSVSVGGMALDFARRDSEGHRHTVRDMTSMQLAIAFQTSIGENLALDEDADA